MELVRPQDGAEAAPWGFIQAASHAIHAVWRRHPSLAEPWLEAYFEGEFRPVVSDEQAYQCRDAGKEVTLLSADATESTTKAMLYLLDYAPPDRKYTHFLVDPFMSSIYAMCQVVSGGQPLPPRPVVKEGEPASPPDPACHRLLYAWAHLIGKQEAQTALSNAQAKAAGELLYADNVPDDLAVSWKKDGASTALVLAAKGSDSGHAINKQSDSDALSILFEYLEMSDTKLSRPS